MASLPGASALLQFETRLNFNEMLERAFTRPGPTEMKYEIELKVRRSFTNVCSDDLYPSEHVR